MVGFTDEHVEHLWQMIESNGGKRVGKRQMADYAIFPMNTVPEDTLQAKQLVSSIYSCASVQWYYYTDKPLSSIHPSALQAATVLVAMANGD